MYYLPNKDLEWKNDAVKTIKIINNLDSVDWLIVDNYGLDKKWEVILRPHVKKIMVIDDMTKREHDCDLILDQNLYENMKECYEGLIPRDCKKLIGPKFALLRKEFYQIRKNLKKPNGKIKRILVSFGSDDHTNETMKVLEAINQLNNNQSGFCTWNFRQDFQKYEKIMFQDIKYYLSLSINEHISTHEEI